MDPYSFDTVVVGIGNMVVSDDGTGVHAARVLMYDPRLPSGIAIIDGGMTGLELVGSIADARRILFLDELISDAPVGTVARISADELLEAGSETSVHQVAIADLVTTLAVVALHSPEVILLAVQPAAVARSKPRSSGVKAAITSLVEAALGQLREWQLAGSMVASL